MKASRGKKLNSGMMLFKDISRRIPTINDVYNLADSLLQDIEPIGGKAWVDAKKAPGGVLDLQLTAREVLDHWCSHLKITPYGGRLYDVLHSIVPRAAEHFQTDLLS